MFDTLFFLFLAVRGQYYQIPQMERGKNEGIEMGYTVFHWFSQSQGRLCVSYNVKQYPSVLLQIKIKQTDLTQINFIKFQVISISIWTGSNFRESPWDR